MSADKCCMCDCSRIHKKNINDDEIKRLCRPCFTSVLDETYEKYAQIISDLIIIEHDGTILTDKWNSAIRTEGDLYYYISSVLRSLCNFPHSSYISSSTFTFLMPSIEPAGSTCRFYIGDLGLIGTDDLKYKQRRDRPIWNDRGDKLIEYIKLCIINKIFPRTKSARNI